MKQFKLFDEEINFSDDECRYRDIDYKYSERGKQAYDEFNLFYKESDKSQPEVFLDEFIEECGNLVSRNVDLLHQDLVEAGVYNYSRDRLIEQYSENIFGHWLQAVQLLSQRFQEIIDAGNGEIKNRDIRKNNRGQWVGGGFNVGGAIRGAVTAGVFNNISGLGHSAVNAIGNTATRSRVRKELRSLVNRKEYFEGISELLYITIKDFERICAYVISLETDIDVAQYNDQDILEQNNILDSLKYITSDREIKNLIICCIQIYPYNKEVYKIAIDRYGDSDCAIEKISEFFNISIRPYKEEILKKVVGEVDYEKEDSMLEAQKKLRDSEQALGVTIPELTQKISQGLQNYDIKMRTVYDIGTTYKEDKQSPTSIIEGSSWVCSTREEAIVINQKIKEIKKIYNNIDIKNEISIEKGRSQILEIAINYNIGNDILEELKDRLNRIDLEAKTVLGEVYSTREEALAERTKVVNGKKYESEVIAEKVRDELQIITQAKELCSYNASTLNKIETLKKLYELKLKTDQGKNAILNTEMEIISDHENLKVQSGDIGKSIISFVLSIIISFCVAIVAVPIGLSAGTIWKIVTIMAVISVIYNLNDKFKEIKASILAQSTLKKIDKIATIINNKVYFYVNEDN